MINELRTKLLDAIDDDWVYFAELEGMIMRITGSSDNLLRRAGEAAAQFVREGVVIPGDLPKDAEGFVPWPSSPAESADRIEREVAAMARDGIHPVPGQVCWFDLPAARD